MSCNPIVNKLQKAPSAFTRQDIITYIQQEGIRHVNFMYPAGDGRLKTLNFVINNAAYLEEILSCGERVDGSSLFPFIEASSSDLYVVPRYRTAFVDPFAELPTLSMLCSFFNKDGEPLESSPEHTLHKACKAFHDTTGMDFEAMGELEYYVIADDPGFYPASDQRGYHESAPYAKFNAFRQECMLFIAQAGGQIKYGHSEVGNFTLQGKIYEQNEIEFLPVPAFEAAEQLLVAKWIIRNLAHSYDLDVTFAPKITIGKAGSGMHVHMRIMKDGKKSIAERVVYGAIDELQTRANGEEDGLSVLKRAINNVKPSVEVKSRRVGGATYQVPVEVNPNRRQALAIRWIADASRRRTEQNMARRLAGELSQAANNEGAAVKKRVDTRRMASSQQGFRALPLVSP
ncbi:MAG TPA: 30S ribosomal protein S7 [Lentisphaeria bacterium]|nr:30S ribosomal protein S7 [Lentisphaeria bacterium]